MNINLDAPSYKFHIAYIYTFREISIIYIYMHKQQMNLTLNMLHFDPFYIPLRLRLLLLSDIPRLIPFNFICPLRFKLLRPRIILLVYSCLPMHTCLNRQITYFKMSKPYSKAIIYFKCMYTRKQKKHYLSN